jgi:hypothetical protein
VLAWKMKESKTNSIFSNKPLKIIV